MATIQVVLTDGTTAYASDVMDNFTEIFTNIDSSNVASTAKTGTGSFVLAAGNPVITGNLCFGTTTSYINGDATHLYFNISSAIAAQLDTANFSIYSRNIAIDSGKKIYLDGGGDTYLSEVSANEVTLYNGGSATMIFSTTQVSLEAGRQFIIPSGKKLLLDGSGSGDTYFIESSANVLDTYVGGSLVTSATSSAFDIDAGTLYVNTSANSVYIGSQTTSTVGSADCKLQVTSSGLNKAAFISTDSGSSAQSIYFYKNSSSPASSDGITNLQFYGNDSGGNATQYASITAFIDDPTNGAEDGRLRFSVIVAGAQQTILEIDNSYPYGGGNNLNVTGSITTSSHILVDSGSVWLNSNTSEVWASGGFSTSAGTTVWESLGGFTSLADRASNGSVSLKINGTTYHLMTAAT